MEFFTVFVLITLAFIVPALLGGPSISYRHLRGTQLTSLWQVGRRLRRWQNDRNTFVWGRFGVPLVVAKQHFLLAGTTRSGKTVLLRLLMQSVFPRIGQGEGHRALVYDGKGELLNVILGIKQSYQSVITFNPLDADGLRYEFAADVIDDASANQAATLLFPKYDSENQPFFSESVQNIAANLMQVFIEIAPGQWRLSHLLYVMRSADRIKAVLGATTKGQDMLSQFEHSGETWGNITATISNRIRDYEIVAALHDHATQSFSVKEWNETESILLLQKSQDCPEVMDALNRVIFTLAKRRLLSKPPSPRRRTWLIFDELASIKSKEVAKDLGLLLEQGASRNICCALAFQNISALRDEFGQHGADRLVALCGTKALLRFEDYVSAEWASGFFGKQEVRITSVSSTSSSGAGGHSSGTSTSYQDQTRWVVEPSEFQEIALPGGDRGVTGFFALPLGKTTLFKDTVPAKWVFSGTTLAPESDRALPERPTNQQRLTITDVDIEQLLKGRVQLTSQSSASSMPTTGTVVTPATAPVVPTPPPSPVPPPASAVPPMSPVPPPPPVVAVPPTPTPPQPAQSASPVVKASKRNKKTAPAAAPPVVTTPVPTATSGGSNPPPGPAAASGATNQPQVWNLANGTVQPASIWSVKRTP